MRGDWYIIHIISWIKFNLYTEHEARKPYFSALDLYILFKCPRRLIIIWGSALPGPLLRVINIFHSLHLLAITEVFYWGRAIILISPLIQACVFQEHSGAPSVTRRWKRTRPSVPTPGRWWHASMSRLSPSMCYCGRPKTWTYPMICWSLSQRRYQHWNRGQFLRINMASLSSPLWIWFVWCLWMEKDFWYLLLLNKHIYFYYNSSTEHY